MDTWTYYAITHADHVVLNPTSPARLDELIGLLELPAEPRVLDIGCGTGELLVRLAERHARDGVATAFHGVGVDASPAFIARARAAHAARAADADHRAAARWMEPRIGPAPGAFDLASCLGASWVFGGHRGTLQALATATRPGGQVLVGEPFWRTEPAPEYLDWSGMGRDDVGSHADNVAIGDRRGPRPAPRAGQQRPGVGLVRDAPVACCGPLRRATPRRSGRALTLLRARGARSTRVPDLGPRDPRLGALPLRQAGGRRTPD